MSGEDFLRTLPHAQGSVIADTKHWMGLDAILWCTILATVLFGLIALYSAVDKNLDDLVSQALRLGAGLVVMLVAAQMRPHLYLKWAPTLYLLSLALVAAVLLVGVEVNGSRRWLQVPGLSLRFQPSELMKIVVPLMVAWYFHDRDLPPKFRDLFSMTLIIGLPVAVIVRQPDLGTGILVAAGGGGALLLAGLSWRWLLYGFLALAAAAPALWVTLQDYQRARILTLFDPEREPLGAGWNIIQSTTALGSGGLFGKGLHNGTQSELNFLPESHTDFIMAVIGEELGFAGVLALLALYMVIVARGLIIATQARSTFSRLASGSLTLVFFVYLFVNTAMVAGLLPVVGVPLPLVSYGGTSAITLMLGFGIIMSVHNHKSW